MFRLSRINHSFKIISYYTGDFSYGGSSFSKLKLIERNLRSIMAHARLSDLHVLRIRNLGVSWEVCRKKCKKFK